MTDPHPLLAVLLAAADGTFPPVDGGVTWLPPLSSDLSGVVSFSGHAFVASPLSTVSAPVDGLGAVLRPAVLLELAGPRGSVGDLDAMLVARGTGGGTLPPRPDLVEHPRVRYARRQRRDVRVHGDERGLVTVSAGLAGRTEVSVETAGAGPEEGRALVAEALALVPPGEPVFAAVSPGHARSLRAFLAVGFVPVGSEVVIHHGW